MRKIHEIINQCVLKYPALICIQNDMLDMIHCIIHCYENKGKLLVCGNGGSAADADHIVGELMKGFLCMRQLDQDIAGKLPSSFPEGLQMPLRAVNIAQNSALTTAIINDLDPYLIFAQQVLGLGDAGDIFWGISTSGNAKDVHYAAMVAKSFNMKLIGLTGECGGQMAKDGYDVLIRVPSSETFEIQEFHLPIYHAICAAVEAFFFRN